MNREQLVQNSVYAAAEATQLSFRERLRRRTDQHIVKRVGKAAAGNVFKVLVDVPASLERHGEQYNLVSNGFENLVYASGSAVVKFNIRTLTNNREQAAAEAARDQEEFESCKPYLGGYWPATSFEVSRFMGRYAVETRQPFIQTIKKFSGVEEMLDYRDDPQYIKQLEDLFTAIGNAYQNTGYYPDVIGANNLALTESMFGHPAIVIFDTGVASIGRQEDKVPNQDTRIKDAIVQKMKLWETRLARSIEPSESREPALH